MPQIVTMIQAVVLIALVIFVLVAFYEMFFGDE
jgi:hypothetical protein